VRQKCHDAKTTIIAGSSTKDFSHQRFLSIAIAKRFVRFEVALFRHSGGSPNSGRTGFRHCLGQVDHGFRRGDEWHAKTIYDQRGLFRTNMENAGQFTKIS
jgi:hypothetical protein